MPEVRDLRSRGRAFGAVPDEVLVLPVRLRLGLLATADTVEMPSLQRSYDMGL